ncbi:MAG: hypothetical protein ABJC74_13690 [Gemmatimonadota bacterium]
MTGSRLVQVLALGLVLLARPAVADAQQDSAFGHARHARLFISCRDCHAGTGDSTRSVWPKPGGCAACHDGQIERLVDWQPHPGPRASNLRFTHAGHAARFAGRTGPDSSLSCQACHAKPGARWMEVGPPLVENCFQCHGLRSVAHLSAPDTTCVLCHLTLPQAVALSPERISRFPAPPSHESPSFAGPGGHGRLAGGVTVDHHRLAIAPSCTVCHAQDFCASCHVDATGIKAIQALARDPRSLAIATRRRPAWHGADFSTSHAALASASGKSCATCHQRAECLDCHRPSAGDGRANYHVAGYLSKHPADAYGRSSDCSQCHNATYFCASCHQQAGLASRGPLRTGYHNAAQFFALGHGKAARESLESCVSCHSERDCLTCHSAIQGRRFNPHGPGFDAARLKLRNPQMCGACHGPNIPG